MAPGRNRTRAVLVGGERSHHCAIPAPQHKKTSPLRIRLTGKITSEMLTSIELVLTNFWSLNNANGLYIVPLQVYWLDILGASHKACIALVPVGMVFDHRIGIHFQKKMSSHNPTLFRSSSSSVDILQELNSLFLRAFLLGLVSLNALPLSPIFLSARNVSPIAMSNKNLSICIVGWELFHPDSN